MKMRPTQGASEPLRTRLIKYMEIYTQTVEPLPPKDVSGTSAAGIGAVRTAFKRSARYNDKRTTVAAPKPA